MRSGEEGLHADAIDGLIARRASLPPIYLRRRSTVLVNAGLPGLVILAGSLLLVIAV